MNPITDKYLAENPGADYFEATLELASNPAHLKDAAFSADLAEIKRWKKAQEPESDFLRGAEVSVRQLKPLAMGVAGLAGKTAGLDSVKDWGLAGYEEGMAKIQPLQSENDDVTQAWDKAKEGDVGALVDWAQYGLGYFAGQAAESVAVAALGALVGGASTGPAAPAGAAGGAVGGLLAKGAVKAAAKAMIEKAVAKEALKISAKEAGKLSAEALAKKAATAEIRNQAAKAVARNIGMTAAVTANSVGMELGSIYPEAEAQAKKEGRELGGSDLARVWGTGLAAGGLEALSDKLGLDLFMGKFAKSGSRLASGATAAAAGVAVEGATEGAQTALERAGAGKPLTGDEATKEYLNAAALGALGGGAAGGIGGVLNPKKNEEVAPPKPAAQADSGLDPAKAYKLGDDEKLRLTALAQREAAGEGRNPDTAADFFTAVTATLNSGNPLDAQRVGFYRSELERLKADEASRKETAAAPLSPPPLAPVEVTAEASTATTAKPLPAAAAAAPSVSQPPVTTTADIPAATGAATPPAAAASVDAEAEAALEKAMALTPEEQAEILGMQVDGGKVAKKKGKKKEAAPAPLAAATDPAPAPSAPVPVVPLKAKEEVAKEEVVIEGNPLAGGGVAEDGKVLEPEEGYIPTQKVMQIAKALVGGPELMKLAEAEAGKFGKADAKGLNQAVAMERAARKVVLKEQLRRGVKVAHEPGNTIYRETAQELGLEKPTAPSIWQKLMAPVDMILARVAEQKAGTAVGAETGPGRKAARLYEEFYGLRKADEIDELYKDRTAVGSNKSLSRKAAVLMSPDKSHVVIGTATIQASKGKPIQYVVGYDPKTGDSKTHRLSALLDDGWTLVGAFKLDEPTKGWSATYSADEWARLQEFLFTLRAAAAGTTEAEQAKIGRDWGNKVNLTDEASQQQSDLEKRGLRDSSESGVDQGDGDTGAVTTVEVEGFTADHAEAIWKDISEVTEWGDVLPAIKSRAGIYAILAAGRALVKIGLSANEISTVLGNTIYEAHVQSRGNLAAFEKYIRNGISQARRGSVESDGAQGANAGGGSASAAGSSSSQAAKAGADASRQAEEEAPASLIDLTVDGLVFNVQRRRGTAFYGEVKGTEGNDGDPGDVYIGPDPDNAEMVWIIDQVNPVTGKFDEHKALFGFASRDEALAAYDSAFDDQSGPKRRGAVTEMERSEFVGWVNEGGYSQGPLARRLVRYSRRFDKAQNGANNSRDAYSHERLPPEADRAVGQGNLRAVTDVARGVHGAVGQTARRPTRGEERAKLEREVLKPAEEAALRQFAQANGLMLDGAEFFRKQEEAESEHVRRTGEPLGGIEHLVYPEGGFFYKANAVDAARTWLRYFHRLALIKMLFGDQVSYEFLGFAEKNGTLYGVTRQKAVRGRKATAAEIIAEMKRRGFVKIDPSVGLDVQADFYNPQTGLIIDDLHDLNAVIDENGTMLIFDAQPAIPYDEDFAPATGKNPITGKPMGGGRLSRFIKPFRMDRTAKLTPDRARTTDARIAAKFRRIIDALRILGVPTNLIKQKVGELVEEFGKYQEFEGRQGQLVRLITLSLADAQRPSLDNLVTLLHEAGHVFMRGLPAELQAQLHSAIRAATNATIGIGNDLRSEIEAKTDAIKQEERIVEAVAQRMAQQGFDPLAAQGLMRATWRLMKAIYQRTAMKLAEVLGRPISPQRAMAYLQNRIEAGLAGDANLLSFLGGRPEVQAEQAATDTLISEAYRRIGFVTDEAGVSPDQDSSALAERDVAKHNEVNATLQKVYGAWNAYGHNPTGLTFEQFFGNRNFVDLGDAHTLPTGEIERINQSLTNGGQTIVSPALRVTNVLNDSMKQRAALGAHSVLSGLRDWMTARRREADRQMPWLINKLKLSAATVAQLTKDYDNADMLLATTRDSVQKMLTGLRRSVGSMAGSVAGRATKLGKLEQVLQEIDSQLAGGALPEAYGKVIDGLYTNLATAAGGNQFMDILEAVSGLGVDWKNDPASKIRGVIALLNDPLLAPLSLNTKESNAMLALTIAFGKENAMVMDLLQLRKTSVTAEKVAIHKLMQQAMADNKDAIESARKEARRLPRLAKLADRLLVELRDVKQRHYELLDEIQRERTFQEFHTDADPLLAQDMVKLESVFGGATEEWMPHQGAEMLVPSGVTATADQVLANKVELDMTKAGRAQMRTWLRRMREWLEAVPAADRGAVWETVKMQSERLAQHDIRIGVHESIRGHFINRLIAPLPDRLELIGSPLARSAAKRIRAMEFWQGSLFHTADANGKRWEVTEAAAMKALGIKRQNHFRKMFYDAALSYIEKRQDILAAQSNPKVAEDMAVSEVLSYLASDPATAALMTPKAKAAMERHIRQTARNATFIESNRKEMGLKVLDQRPGYSMYREAIGATPFTVMRGLSGEAVRTYVEMQATWGRKTATGLEDWNKADAAVMHRAGTLPAEIAASFGGKVWQRFLRPLVQRTGRSAFYAPQNPDGTHNFAMRERVIKAYESAGGDVVAFAENLFALEGGTGDVSEFVGETIETLQSFYTQLRMIGAETENAEQQGMPTVRRFLADARKSEEFPAEWLEYAPYDVHTLRQMVKGQSYHVAYGRNLEGMRKDLAAAQAEQQEWADRHKELEMEFPGLQGRKLEAAMKLEATARGWDWTILKEAARNRQTLVDVEAKFNAHLEMHKQRPPEIGPWQEIIGAAAGATVSGPATALIDTISVPEQAFRRFGLNTEALKYVLSTGKSLSVQALGSLLQAFTVSLRAEVRYNKMLLELGRYDTDAVLSFTAKFRASMSEHTNAGMLMKPLVLGARAVRYGLSTGFGARAKPGADVVFPTVKPHSIFTYLGQMVNSASIIGWWKRYDAYVGMALKHYEANPADLADDSFQFTAKQLGLSDRAYAYITNSLAEYGVPSLEQLGADALTRRRTDPTAALMLPNHYRALAALSQNQITMESSLSTRAPRLMTDWNIANPLLGWSVQKSYDAWRGFREPDGKASAKGFRSGLAVYAAILPLGLAYALMRDWYDEDILGKKGNMRDITTVDGPQEAFLTLLENTARVGTFGIAGEFANKTFNYDATRDVSLDNRIFFVSSLISLEKSLVSWMRQGNADWATVGRPLVQSLGGGGYFQYAGVLNNALGLDNAEARVSNRISVNNYLRVAGRELKLDVRPARNSDSAPNPVKPFIGQMVMAAYANDAGGFREAWQAGVKEAIAGGRTRAEALDYVQRSYSSYHPLRTVFKTAPDEREYRKLLASMNDNGKTTVATAINLLNHYGEQVKNAKGEGLKANTGGQAKRLTLDELRRRAAAY